jgi:hypothetical protein
MHTSLLAGTLAGAGYGIVTGRFFAVSMDNVIIEEEI